MKTSILLFLIAWMMAACAGPQPTPTLTPSPTDTPAPTLTPTPTLDPAMPSPLSEGWARGAEPQNAGVTAVLYGDITSARSVEVAAMLKALIDRHTDRLRFVWRHHGDGLPVLALEAAGARGKFWEVFDCLAAGYEDWSLLEGGPLRDALGGCAEAAGIDADAMWAEIDAGAYDEAVKRAAQDVAGRGIDAAEPPVIFLNGERYDLPPGMANLRALDADIRLMLLKARQYPHQPSLVIDLEKHYRATLVTEKGEIVIDLFPACAPVTVNSFVYLAQDGFYNDITFHYVVPGLLAVTGDPSGTGRGGPGYRIVDEICDDLRFDRAGRVAMFHPVGLLNANGSQFFITYGPVHTSFRYDGEFTIFGQVVEGLEVLEALTPRQRDDLPESFLPHGDKLHTIRIEMIE